MVLEIRIKKLSSQKLRLKSVYHFKRRFFTFVFQNWLEFVIELNALNTVFEVPRF